ncbi:MAG: ATP phosphoribosyltransferase, partial [Mitsuokella jalaludinii]|nr:ATP phosphoribosyltransferase [Mitsuokella jalaludinii]
MQMEYIKLNGSIELGPIVGLSESIVDIVETGTTLKENDLEEIAYILDATARLIVNRVSFKLKFDRISQLTEELRKILELEQQAKAEA